MSRAKLKGEGLLVVEDAELYLFEMVFRKSTTRGITCHYPSKETYTVLHIFTSRVQAICLHLESLCYNVLTLLRPPQGSVGLIFTKPINLVNTQST